VLEVRNAGVERDDLELLVEKLSANVGDDADAHRCLVTLLNYEDDLDLIHDSVMKLHPEVVERMFAFNRASSRRLIELFSEFTADQSWGFGYTDRIGSKCREIFLRVNDGPARASLTLCAVEVGVDHSRWKVIGIAKEMLLAMVSAGDVLALVERLRGVPRMKRYRFGRGLELPRRLDPRVRELLIIDKPTAEEEEEDN
jgi:hypothetical protein